MWKFHSFFVTQILREIKVGFFGGPKIAIYTLFAALWTCMNFLPFLEAKIFHYRKVRATKVAKMALFELPYSPK